MHESSYLILFELKELLEMFEFHEGMNERNPIQHIK